MKKQFVCSKLKELIEMSMPEGFYEKLQEKMNWSTSGTSLAVEEYLRFVALSAASERIVPSQAVDEVWHLHLTYTKHYWKEMCAKVLQQEFHHEPSKNTTTMKNKDTSDYQKTLKLYETFFEEVPPVEVWSENSIENMKNSF